MIRRQQTLRRPRLPAQQIFDDRRPVRRIRQSLPHLALRQNRIIEIERQISQHCPRLLLAATSPCSFASVTTMSGVRELIVASAEPLRSSSARTIASGTIRNAQPLDFRRAAKIILIALQDDFFIRRRAHKSKRPRPNRMLRHLRSRPARHDSDSRRRKIPQQRRVRFAQMEHDGGVIGCLDGGHQLEGLRLGVFTAPERMESNVNFTSAEVSGRPS